MGTDAYVSPDWYKSIVTVPTWNYIAVEGEGVVLRTSREELRQLVIDLSAQEEHKLLPKRPWLIDKVPHERQEALLNGIAGFTLVLKRLEGKFKLSQDKQPEDIAGVLSGLEARGDATSSRGGGSDAEADKMKWIIPLVARDFRILIRRCRRIPSSRRCLLGDAHGDTGRNSIPPN